MNKNFWTNKNVLVTGFKGFLGSNLTKRLLSYNAKVVGLDIKTGWDKTILAKDDYRKMLVIKGNVCNYKLVKDIVSRHGIAIIFHLAAEAIVGECVKKPIRAFSSNINGTWNVLEACRFSEGVDAVIVASSDKAYGSHDELPYREDAPLRGKHPYDASKSCADLLAHTYYHTYGVPVAITRCGNIYGPGDFNFSRVLPDVCRCALNGKKFFIRSDGKFTRDYIYVDDIVNGYLLLAEKLQEFNLHGEAFNFSDENPITVIDVVKKIYGLIGKKPNYKVLNEARYEIMHQYLCSKKARKILGWTPGHSLREGLEKTIRWYGQDSHNNAVSAR